MRHGLGSESQPYFSANGTAGIDKEIKALSERGGLVHLANGRYDLSETICIDTPCIRLEGDVWAYNSDPNGVFETRFGTKLRMTRPGFPALSVGITRTAEGCVIRDLGIQGDIKGMDTRPLFNMDKPLASSGLTFSHTRIDQAEFSKLSFCGLHCAVCATADAEIDACRFEGLNVDGCAVGMYFAPRAAYYVRFNKWVAADNPYYALYVYGRDRQINNLDISDIHFIRCGGAFTENDGHIHAGVCLEDVNGAIFRENLIDDAGIFWYFDPEANQNSEHQVTECRTISLFIRGNNNKILNNIVTNSHAESMVVEGSGNVLLNNIVDGNVVLRGHGNTVNGLVFTTPDARLLVSGRDNSLTGVPEDRILYI